MPPCCSSRAPQKLESRRVCQRTSFRQCQGLIHIKACDEERTHQAAGYRPSHQSSAPCFCKCPLPGCPLLALNGRPALRPRCRLMTLSGHVCCLTRDSHADLDLRGSASAVRGADGKGVSFQSAANRQSICFFACAKPSSLDVKGRKVSYRRIERSGVNGTALKRQAVFPRGVFHAPQKGVGL